MGYGRNGVALLDWLGGKTGNLKRIPLKIVDEPQGVSKEALKVLEQILCELS